MASAPPTGCEWRAIKTPDGRHTYYTNTRTNETTWTKPAGFIDANGRAQNKVEGTEWVEVSQPSGPSYFHNPKSGEVTWHAPEEVKAAFAARAAAARAGGPHAAAAPPSAPAMKPAPPPAPTQIPAPAREPADDPTIPDDDFDFDVDDYEVEPVVPVEEIAPAPAPTTTTTTDAPEPSPSSPSMKNTFTVPVPPPPAAADPFIAAREAKEAAADAFRGLLRERGVDGKARWDRWSGKLATDPRFKRVATPQQRRSVFEKFTRQVADEEKAAKRAEKEGKKELGKSNAVGTGKHPGEEGEVADARRRREERVRREKREEADRLARQRRMIDRESAMARFKALLAESVRDPEATWAQSLPALQRDVQGRCVFGRGTVMDEFELRDEFLNHVAGLLRKVATDARVLLEETIKATCKEDFDVPEPPTPKDGDDDEDDDEDDEDDDEDGTPLTSFVAAAEVLSHDPRFEKCPLNERARLYCEHIRKLCDEHGAKVPRDVEALAQELEKARLEEARERAAIDAEETAKARGWRGDDREQSRDHRDSRPPRRSRSRSRDRGRKRSRSRSR